jgi:hypothetical protein
MIGAPESTPAATVAHFRRICKVEEYDAISITYMLAERKTFELSIWFCIQALKTGGKQPLRSVILYIVECVNACPDLEPGAAEASGVLLLQFRLPMPNFVDALV